MDRCCQKLTFTLKEAVKQFQWNQAEERLWHRKLPSPAKPTATETQPGQYFSKLMCLKIRRREMSMVVQACMQCSPGGDGKSGVQSHPQLILASLMPALALIRSYNRKPKRTNKKTQKSKPTSITTDVYLSHSRGGPPPPYP